MGGGGGKGGTQETTTKVELPEELNQAAGEVLGAGFRAAALPYSPNRGVTIAGFAPQQEAAMRGANSMAEAFGLPSIKSGNLGIAKQRESVRGIEGYSTGGLYDQMKGASMSPAELAEREQQRRNLGNASDRIYEKAGIDAGLGLLPQPQATEPLYSEDELNGMGGLQRALARNEMGQNPRGGNK